MRKPDFIGIGVAKSGTTALQQWLLQHPSVFVPKQKEVHFFDNEYTWQKGINWYEKIFTCAEINQICGEISPGYFENSDLVIPRIKRLIGERGCLFILILRNPIERAYSHWNFYRCYYGEKNNFEDAIRLEWEGQGKNGRKTSYFSDGLYAKRIEAWINGFGEKSIKILLNEEMRFEPSNVWASICSFLNIKKIEINLEKKANVASSAKSKMLMNFMSNPPWWASSLVKHIMSEKRRGNVKQKLYELNARPVKLPQMDNTIKKELIDRYTADIINTEKIIGKDLSGWYL